MRLFYTKSVEHLARKIKLKKGKFIISTFPDREIYVKINEKVKNRRVAVLAATNPPAENLLELMFLLDTLQRGGAKINLFLTYFGYARQDRAEEGEAFTGKLICSWLRDFKVKKIKVLHMHSPRLKKFLKFEEVIPYQFFSSRIAKNDVVVAPDLGALKLAQKLSKIKRCPMAVITKKRINGKVQLLSLRGNVKGKRVVIVDDMVSTGSTVIKAAELLKQKGAKEVRVMATHGVFAGDAVRKLENSPISKIYITNSLPQKIKSKKIEVVDASNFLEKQIKSIF